MGSIETPPEELLRVLDPGGGGGGGSGDPWSLLSFITAEGTFFWYRLVASPSSRSLCEAFLHQTDTCRRYKGGHFLYCVLVEAVKIHRATLH